MQVGDIAHSPAFAYTTWNMVQKSYSSARALKAEGPRFRPWFECLAVSTILS